MKYTNRKDEVTKELESILKLREETRTEARVLHERLNYISYTVNALKKELKEL